MGLRRPYRLAFLFSLLLSACASTPEPAAPAAPPLSQATLDRWPYRAQWSGVTFNAAKIGYSRQQLSQVSRGEHLLRTEAILRFRFLAYDKRVHYQGEDQVNDDLTLRDFRYRHDTDGNILRLEGRVRDGRLEVEVATEHTQSTQNLTLDAPLYPVSALALYPLLHGLEIGRRYDYQVFDGETQSIAAVTQEVRAPEPGDRVDQAAFKLVTTLHGNETVTWLTARGIPVRESSLGGVFVARLESEAGARRYLAAAAGNKEETLLNYSLVPVEGTITDPRRLARLSVVLEGLDRYSMPSDAVQRCLPNADGLLCTVTPGGDGKRVVQAELQAAYLAPSLSVPSEHPTITRLADEISSEGADRSRQMRALVAWIQRNVRREAVDVYSALDVLKLGSAECQGHSYLYAALARSLGLPTRVVNGLVYSTEHRGFLYHTWVESWTDHGWIAVDPTFGQIPADATHIKLVEGESAGDIAPLTGLIGRLKARVVALN